MCKLSAKSFVTILILLICGTYASHAAAAEEEASGYWSFQLENDVFASSGDRYYTHGTQLSYMHMVPEDYWLNDIALKFPFYSSGQYEHAVNHTLGQKIFTPSDTKAISLVKDDRPYAGYLYYTITALARITRNQFYDEGNLMGFTIGVVGPGSGARELQNWYHDSIGIDSPRGWDNQLKNEPALGLSYSRIWSIVLPISNGYEFGVTPHITGVFGNVYTYGAGGVMFRLGTHLKGDLSPPNISPGFPGASFFDLSEKYNWYLFAGHESRIVARNIFLDGNTFQSGPHVDKELVVGDYQFGFAIHFNKMRFAISHMLRTKEFKGQKDNTQYGEINFSFAL
jgi:hypothetical protein